jgi:hypothetical protein
VALARGGTTILAAQLAVHNDGACLALTSARVDLRCSRALSCPAWALSAAEGIDSSGSRMAVHTLRNEVNGSQRQCRMADSPVATMRLDLSGPFLESLTGKP